MCVCALFARVYVQRREYATDATGALLFFPVLSPPPPHSSPPSSRGWNSFRGPTPPSPTNGTVRLLRLSLLYSSEAHPFSPRSPNPLRRSFSSFALARESRFAVLPSRFPRNVRARRDKSGSRDASRKSRISRCRCIQKSNRFRVDVLGGRRRWRRGKPEHPRISRETKKIQFTSIHVL